MACTECNNTTPCSQPCTGCKVFLGSECTTYTGTAIECLGIETNTELTTVLEKMGEAICEFTPTPSTTQIINVGTGSILYSGDDGQGRKQFKTLTEGDGIILTPSSTEINVAVDPDYIADNAGNLIFENIVEFNTADPNSGSPTFVPDQPEDDDVLYWSNVDNTNWKWNGTAYVTAPDNPNSTPFMLADTTNDAGGNKTADIWRRGNIGIGVQTPTEAIDVNGFFKQTGVTSSIIKADATGKFVNAVAGTDYLTPTGDASLLTNFPTLNQNTTGNAATVTTNANLSGDVTSVGNVTTIAPTGVTAGTYVNANVTVNAKGQVVGITNGGGTLALKDFPTSSSNNTNVLTTLYAYTIPANTLTADGDKIKAEYAGKLDNGTSKDVIIGLGANTYTFKTSVDGSFTVKVNIIKTGAAATTASIEIIVENLAYIVSVEQWTITGWNANTALNLSALAVNTGDVIAYMGSIVYIPAAL